MFCRVLVLVCLLLGLSVPAEAQRRRPPKKPPMEPFAADGTIVAVGPDRIQILTTSNQQWLIFFDPKAVIHVTGTAEADFLRAGMFIKFTAEVDKRGRVQGKVGELTIFTPSPENPPGIWPEGIGPPAGADGDRFGGKAGGNGGGNGGAGASSIYTVAGQLTGARRGKLTVNAGAGVVQFELAESPRIKVDIADFTVAGKGDKISISKGKMPAGTMGIAQASAVTIELAEPLTLAKKRPVPPKKSPPPKRTTRRPDQPDPERQPFGVQPEGDPK